MIAIVERMVSTGFGTYLTVFGTLLAALGLGLLVKRLRLSRWRANGEIIAYRRELNPRHHARRMQFATIRFYAPEHGWSEFEFSTSLDSRLRPVGSHVPVGYDPQRKGRATVALTHVVWLPPLAILLFSAVLFFAAWDTGTAAGSTSVTAPYFGSGAE